MACNGSEGFPLYTLLKKILKISILNSDGNRMFKHFVSIYLLLPVKKARKFGMYK